MTPRSSTLDQFRRRALIAVEDVRLQNALEAATGRFRATRSQALAELPDADALRDHFKAIRSTTLAMLAAHLEEFERNARAAGAHVHWAADGAEAADIVVAVGRRRQVKLVTKSKSMATEEIHLNDALMAAGIDVVETDLGEWIIQLAAEPPSHIIAPAIHKTRFEVAELFSRQVGRELPGEDIPLLTAVARDVLRQKFLASDMGISGGNIAVAESGSIVLVTNEGNAEMVTSLPPVHVVVIGIEKVAPTWDDAAVWLSLLARSATGQPLSIYTTVVTGPARPEDADGPRELHIILLDNGRSRLVGTQYEEVLQCIRCGACLNICPVYREAGGHAYGSPYSGPIGAVVTPLLFGLETYAALPHASSLCGACRDACPVRIDLPRMLVELRQDEVQQRLLPRSERLLERAAAYVLRHPRLMRMATAALRLLQRPFLRDGVLHLPPRFHPAGERQLPGLAPRSFRQWWREQKKDE
jgi:L-lactate dehydrogenase complex protein LldF